MTAPKHSTLSTLSTQKHDFSHAQQQVVAALAQGRTITAAAQAQVHRSTIYNWRNVVPAFRQALAQARSEYVAQFSDELEDLSATALATLRTVLQDALTPSSVRLRAALAILQRPDWRLRADAEPNPRDRDRELDRQVKEQLLALGSDTHRPPFQCDTVLQPVAGNVESTIDPVADCKDT